MAKGPTSVTRAARDRMEPRCLPPAAHGGWLERTAASSRVERALISLSRRWPAACWSTRAFWMDCKLAVSSSMGAIVHAHTQPVCLGVNMNIISARMGRVGPGHATVHDTDATDTFRCTRWEQLRARDHTGTARTAAHAWQNIRIGKSLLAMFLNEQSRQSCCPRSDGRPLRPHGTLRSLADARSCPGGADVPAVGSASYSPRARCTQEATDA